MAKIRMEITVNPNGEEVILEFDSCDDGEMRLMWKVVDTSSVENIAYIGDLLRVVKDSYLCGDIKRIPTLRNIRNVLTSDCKPAGLFVAKTIQESWEVERKLQAKLDSCVR